MNPLLIPAAIFGFIAGPFLYARFNLRRFTPDTKRTGTWLAILLPSFILFVVATYVLYRTYLNPNATTIADFAAMFATFGGAMVFCCGPASKPHKHGNLVVVERESLKHR